MPTLEKRAEIAQTALFERYDELTVLWTKAEQELTARHVPHTIEFTYSYPSCAEEADDDPYAKAIGIAKKNGAWRLCHAERHYCDQSEYAWTPIVDCSAFTRVHVTKYLPKLREAVVTASERFIPEVDEAIARLKKELSAAPDGALLELLSERAKLNGQQPTK